MRSSVLLVPLIGWLGCAHSRVEDETAARCMAEHGDPDAHPDDNPALPDDEEEAAEAEASAPIAGTGP